MARNRLFLFTIAFSLATSHATAQIEFTPPVADTQPATQTAPLGGFGSGGTGTAQPQPYQIPAQQAQTPEVAQPAPRETEAQPRLRLCTARDMIGVWKVARVLEQPEGTKTKNFKNHPFQYLWMTDKNRLFYGKYKEDRKDTNNIKKALVNSNKGKTYQYVLGEQGVLYIYLNQTFSYSHYCAISEEAVGIYRIGDMLLTPTASSTSKVFEVYRQVISPK